MLLAEVDYGGDGIVTGVRFDHDSHAAALSGSQADKCLENVGFGDNADQAVLA